MSLVTRWFKHLSKVEHEDFKKTIFAHRIVLERLKDLLEEDLAASIKVQENKINYKESSWPMFQADCIGEQRTLKKLINLITIEEK